MPLFPSLTPNQLSLEAADKGDIYSHVSATGKVGQENVGWLCIPTREQGFPCSFNGFSCGETVAASRASLR